MAGNQGVPFQPNSGGRVPLDASAEQLAQLAVSNPELWDEIWKHPNCYDGLRQWMSEQYTLHGLVQQPTSIAQSNLSQQAAAYPWQPTASSAPETAVVPGAFGEPKKRRHGVAVVASIAAAALVLAGTGTALAMTGTLTNWLSGSSSGAEPVLAEGEAEAGPSFAGGAEERWTYTGPEGMNGRVVLGGLPRMMVSYERRSSQPVQIEGAVIFQGGRFGSDQGFIELIDASTGEAIWTESMEGSGYCVPAPDGKRASCKLSMGLGAEESEIVTLTSAGEQARFGVDMYVAELQYIDDDLLLFSGDSVMRVNASGKVLWRSEGLGLEGGGSQLQAAGPWVLASTWGGWALLGEGGRVVHVDNSLDMGNTNANDRCDFMLTEQKLLMVGAACDDSVDLGALVPEVIDRKGDAMSIGLVPGKDGVWLRSHGGDLSIYDATQTTAYDALTGEETWVVDGKIPGWFQAPQRVSRESGDGVLLFGPVTKEALLVDLATGATDKGGVGTSANQLAFSVDSIVAGDTEIGVLEFIDPSSMETLGSLDFVPDMEVLGGSEGLLVPHPVCTDCSTAEGAQSISSYTFYGPTGGGTAIASETDLKRVLNEAPDFVPACPTDTVLLAWMELENGWIVVCGVDIDTPSYVGYKPNADQKASYSQGASKPTSKLAKDSVSWDSDQKRYVATMANGSVLTLDYPIGTATSRESASSATVKEQERFIRYVYVPLGSKVRGIADAAGESGAFDVKTPKATADDQVRYMIEVLQKAYEGRALLKDALPKLAGCTAGAGGYSDTIAAMQAVRDNRAELLQALDAMPVDKIPEGKLLLADLTEAIELSHQANVEYVAWAQAANANGCASLSASGKAAADASDAPKDRFAARWNSVVAPKFKVRTFDAWFI